MKLVGISRRFQVTNAEWGWVELTAARFLPAVEPLLRDVESLLPEKSDISDISHHQPKYNDILKLEIIGYHRKFSLERRLFSEFQDDFTKMNSKNTPETSRHCDFGADAKEHQSDRSRQKLS